MSLLTAYDKFIQVALKYGFSLFGLPKSGQTTVYQAGDDGTYKKGYPKTGARFVDNGDGTVTDNATGLMWPKDKNGAGCFGGGTRWFAEALLWAEGLSFAGYTDWRLPNVKELQSLVNYGRVNPSVDIAFFTSLSLTYWSSTTHAGVTANAWHVHFHGGLVGNTVKTTGYYVRAVRGGA